MNWLKHIDFKYLLIALIPCSIMLGPVPHVPLLYYAFLAIMGFMAISKSRYTCPGAILFLIACALSIIIAHPAPVFKSWPRLLLFVLLLLGVFPIFDNPKVFKFRYEVLKYSLWFCTIVGVTGVICFKLGINYNTILAYARYHTIEDAGWFAGLSKHSMMLGPCCAIGEVLLTWLAFDKKRVSGARKWLCWGGVALCFVSSLLSASRSAVLAGVVGVVILMFYVFRGKIMQIAGLGIVLGGLLYFGFPLYEQYANPLVQKQEENNRQGGAFSSREAKWNNRIEEFKSDPIFGVGFVAVLPENTNDYDPYSGTVESGSSWFQLLSMTGLLGTLTFAGIFFPTVMRLSKRLLRTSSHSYGTLIMALLGVLCTSMCAEGYLLAGGSFFCYMFWLILGIAYSLTHNYPDRI